MLRKGKTRQIVDLVRSFAEPIVKENGCELWDVEYVREGADWFLRLYLDKEGGVDIDDCERISRAIDPILDEKDPIPESYHFEVCSAGLERVETGPGDFWRWIGIPVGAGAAVPAEGRQQGVCRDAGGV